MAHKQIDQELSDRLKKWNPMVDDFTNTKFNQYCSGPGANIDPALQPGEQAAKLHRPQGATNDVTIIKPYLVFKQMPKDMTTKALHHLCMQYGRVEHVRNSNKNDYFFVDLASINDMEAVYRGLERNNYGFHVFVGKQYNNNNAMENSPSTFDMAFPKTTPKNTIDMQNRKYRASDKNPPRPQFKKNPIISVKQYEAKNNMLQRNDPQRHFCIEDDAHTLERAGYAKPYNSSDNSNYNYRTGRAFIRMPDKTKQLVEEKSRNSQGQFDASQDKYKKKGNQDFNMPKAIGKCWTCQRPCDLICARCSTYFCCIECQRQAWPQHRFHCGRSNETENAPPPKINNTTPNFGKDKNSANKSATSGPNTIPEITTIKTPLFKSIRPEASRLESSGSAPLFKPPVVKSVVEKNKMPRSGNLVTLTAISKTNLVFIRSKTYEDNLDFFKTVNNIQATAKDLKPLTSTPNCGQIVIAKFEGHFNRAMVLNVSNLDAIQVVYIDYGNLDKQKLDDLYAVPERFADLPRFAIPVILKDVPSVCLNDNIRKFMYSYLDGMDLVIKYKPNEDFLADRGVHCVELIDESSNQNFNKVVATLSKPVEPKDVEEIYFREYLQQIPLPRGENVELTVMDNSLLSTGCISCTTKECALEIQKFQKEVQAYGESLEKQCYAPRINELCIAKYSVDNKWYRGRCIELAGDGHPTIIFFDYGNLAMVNVKFIRRYPQHFTYPVYTADCGIDGLPDHCDAKAVEKLEELVPNGSTIVCDLVEFYEEDFFHAITLKKVVEELESSGLLKEENESEEATTVVAT